MSDLKSDKKGEKRRKWTQSLVFNRLGVQLPVLLLFMAFGISVSIYLFREIAADRFRIMHGDDPIYFEAGQADGLGFGSELRCQGLVVGRIRAVKVLQKEGQSYADLVQETRIPETQTTVRRVQFQVEATLEKPFRNWVFRDNAYVIKGVGPAYLGLSSIQLEINQILSPEQPITPQRLKLHSDEGSNLQKLQDRVGLILEALTRKSDQLALRIQKDEASSFERILWNIDQSTTKLNSSMGRLDAAIEKLTEDQNGEESPLSRLITTIHRLSTLVDELGTQVKQLTSETTDTVKLSQEAIQKLSKKVDEVEKNTMQVIGETNASRRALHSEIVETIQNFKTVSGLVKELIPRVGDTGLGKMLIRKKEVPAASPTPTPPKNRGNR